MIPKTGIIPPGGHHFIERHGTTERRIEGSSYDDVAEQLLRYRVANGIPLGQPRDEIVAYVCGTWPHFCAEQLSVPPPVSSKPGYIAGVTMWLQELAQRQAMSPKPLVGDEEANRRAEICRGCPLQKTWEEGCGSCRDSIRRQGFVFRAGKDVSNAKKVLGCSVLFQENHAAAWAHKDVLPPVPEEDKARLPHNCWRR
jgi:hypothetical protein